MDQRFFHSGWALSTVRKPPTREPGRGVSIDVDPICGDRETPHCLPHFPRAGIGAVREVLKAKLIEKAWMGESIVVWCDENGRACVSKAICPHLGSDLGPTAGGRICGGRLVCPFHGFEFDATGECVATPYTKPPKSARLRVFETKEVVDLIFAWWGIEGRAPQWSLPADSPDQSGWSNLEIKTMRFPGHPQETTENSVDLGHLRFVHGYGNVDRVERVSIDGPLLESNFDFRRTQKIAKSRTIHR